MAVKRHTPIPLLMEAFGQLMEAFGYKTQQQTMVYLGIQPRDVARIFEMEL